MKHFSLNNSENVECMIKVLKINNETPNTVVISENKTKTRHLRVR